MSTIRLAFRGFTNNQQQFEERVEIEETDLDEIVPALAEKHANVLASHALHMIEIEFLDEPDPLQRFFRFGSDPAGMALPIAIDLQEAQ